jgi:GAF domain-containing protein
MEQVVQLSDAAQGKLSLDEQLGHVLDTARAAVAVDRLHFWAIAPEGDTLLYVRGSGLSERDRRSLSERPQVRLADAAAMARAFRDRSTLLVNDGVAGPLQRNAAVKAVGAKSFFVLPVIARDRPLGLLVADNDYGGSPLIPEALGLLSTFALHLATTVDNALLRDEMRARDPALTESLEQQTATSEVLRVISRSPIDLQPVLDAVAERAAQL